MNCWGYNREGNVYIQCSGQTAVELTHTKDVDSWGISPNGELLGVIRNIEGLSTRELDVIELSSGKIANSRSVSGNPQIQQTCGTLLLMGASAVRDTFTAFDLQSNKEVEFPPVKDIRCSRGIWGEFGDGNLGTDGTDPNFPRPNPGRWPRFAPWVWALTWDQEYPLRAAPRLSLPIPRRPL